MPYHYHVEISIPEMYSEKVFFGFCDTMAYSFQKASGKKNFIEKVDKLIEINPQSFGISSLQKDMVTVFKDAVMKFNCEPKKTYSYEFDDEEIVKYGFEKFEDRNLIIDFKIENFVIKNKDWKQPYIQFFDE